MFNPGQRVVCVKPHAHNYIRVGEIYTVLEARVRCKCGVTVDVGIPFPPAKPGIDTTRAYCTTCHVVYPSNGHNWFSADKFAPLESDDLSDVFIEDVIEEMMLKG